MTIEANLTNRTNTNGNGVTTAFSYPYPFHEDTDIVVISTVIATGVQTVKVLTTHYTISGTQDDLGHYPSGATITFVTAPASTERITIYGDPAMSQTLNLQDAGDFSAENIEATLDKQVLIERRTRDLIGRALRQPEGDSDTIGLLPAKVDRVNKSFTWDSSGNPSATDLESASGTSVTSTGGDTPRSLAERADEYVNVKDFGALGDDSNDDTDAIQDAFDYAVSLEAATVVFPRGVYRHTALTLAPSSGQIHVNLLGLGGAGANGVTLKYTGTGGTALTIANNTRYQVENLRFEDAGTGAVGLHLTSLTVGSNHGNAEYHNIYMTGFQTNLQIGTTDNKAASELLFSTLEVVSATIGILIVGPSAGSANFSSGIHFQRLNGSSCVTLLTYSAANDQTGSIINVDGGSVSNNTREFDIQGRADVKIENVTTENSGDGQLIRTGSATATENSEYAMSVTLENIQCNYPSSPSNRVIQFNQPGHYKVKQCSIQTGSILLGGYDGGGAARRATLDIEGGTIASVDAPVIYRAASNTIWNVRMRQVGSSADEMQNQHPDKSYEILADGSERPIGQNTLTASTSGSSISFLSLPAGIKRITVLFRGVSLSGTDNLLVQLGDAGGAEVTNYIASSSNQAGTVVNSTAGFIITSGDAAFITTGALVLTLMDAATNLWIAHGVFKSSTGALCYAAGEKALSAVLDRIVIDTTGTDTFDAGSVNVLYES